MNTAPATRSLASGLHWLHLDETLPHEEHETL